MGYSQPGTEVTFLAHFNISLLMLIADPKELNEAQAFLEHAAQENLAGFLVGLCQVLASPVNSQVSRMAAGLQV